LITNFSIATMLELVTTNPILSRFRLLSPASHNAQKMIQIQCGNCQRNLKVPIIAAGKNARCPCGEKILISFPSNEPDLKRASERPVASASSGFTQGCECGRKLRVPQSDSTKMAKCPSGKTFEVPAVAQHSYRLGLIALVRGLFDGD
jgi:uncharacterized paraquat-inducible protein A